MSQFLSVDNLFYPEREKKGSVILVVPLLDLAVKSFCHAAI